MTCRAIATLQKLRATTDTVVYVGYSDAELAERQMQTEIAYELATLRRKWARENSRLRAQRLARRAAMARALAAEMSQILADTVAREQPFELSRTIVKGKVAPQSTRRIKRSVSWMSQVGMIISSVFA